MKKEEFFRDKSKNSKGPLEGIRILEATHTQAGPFALLRVTLQEVTHKSIA